MLGTVPSDWNSSLRCTVFVEGYVLPVMQECSMSIDTDRGYEYINKTSLYGIKLCTYAMMLELALVISSWFVHSDSDNEINSV